MIFLTYTIFRLGGLVGVWGRGRQCVTESPAKALCFGGRNDALDEVVALCLWLNVQITAFS